MKQIIKRKADCAGTSKINCNLALIFTSEPQKSLSSLLQWERRGTFPLARAGHCGTEGLPVRGGGGGGRTTTHRDTRTRTAPRPGPAAQTGAPAASAAVPRGAELGLCAPLARTEESHPCEGEPELKYVKAVGLGWVFKIDFIIYFGKERYSLTRG